MSKRKDERKTTPQQLRSVLKSARDIMRKDKGLSGELDRLPMLTWIMFLKFLDDTEMIRETEAILEDKNFKPCIEPPYRWRDWAAQEDGITGDALINFINNEEVIRPDGTKCLGLFTYLRQLQSENGEDRRDVIATIFRETYNRMINGYLLRDVINNINRLNFTSSQEIHTLSFFYESMLKELRDVAGDSGEFYTPRPVIRLMVKLIDPKLGEIILDPACGTCGFLVEAYEHLKKQCKTTEDFDTLQKNTLFGGEAKPLPYLLGQMNMLLHGIEYPQIDYGNSLRYPLREIGDKERIDIVLTNPPFGGAEERSILRNYPTDKQTAETALLFLQLIMRKLRRKIGKDQGGRCAIVVPNGTLFGDGICARIKEELLEEFNLHTIIRLPKGVFTPYTDIPTNLLFFEKGGSTKNMWFYEHPLPPERQKIKNPCYTKTMPLRFNEFEPLIEWWGNRLENEHAWKISVSDIIKYNDDGKLLSINLDINNPNKKETDEFIEPKIIVEKMLTTEKEISSILNNIKKLIDD